MKIIVCGAGEVGSNIAKQLVYEDNDVTIIDESEPLLRRLNQNLDLKSICGKPCHPEILENAGADEADMIIAVSDIDESNIVTCELANHLFKIPLKFLLNKKNMQIQNYTFNGCQRSYYTIPYGPYYIWGATAYIIKTFSDLVENYEQA